MSEQDAAEKFARNEKFLDRIRMKVVVLGDCITTIGHFRRLDKRDRDIAGLWVPLSIGHVEWVTPPFGVKRLLRHSSIA